MTVAEGLVAPGKVATLVGLFLEGKLGVSDIRATYGGLFVGLERVFMGSPDGYA